jgi:hypothetical protein
MKLKQKVKSFLLSGLLVGAFFTGITLLTPQLATADDACTAGSANCCAGVKTSIISCSQSGGTSPDPSNSGLWGVLILAINILTAGVGIAAIGGVVYGAVLYASAGGSQEQVKKAITTFTNVGIGVVAYALMWALLNFLVPGGVFN